MYTQRPALTRGEECADGERPITQKARAAYRQLTAPADGRAADLLPVIEEPTAAGITSLRGIAAGLDERGISTARGHGPWSPGRVHRLMKRLRSTVG
jgi:hypothetical protein